MTLVWLWIWWVTGTERAEPWNGWFTSLLVCGVLDALLIVFLIVHFDKILFLIHR